METTTLARPAPRPRLPGSLLLGHLLPFRRDRFGLGVDIGRQAEPVVALRIGLFTTYMASTAAAAHEILVDKADSFLKSRGIALFARPVLGNGLLSSEGEVHKRQRRLLAPVFAHKRIASYAELMVEKTLLAVDRMTRASAGSEPPVIDVAEEMMRLTLDIVGKALFDAELAGEASAVGEALTYAMRQMMDAMVRLIPTPPSVPTPGNLRLLRAVRELDAIVYGMIRERRASGVDRGDMLGMLLATRDADDGSALDDQEVRDQAMTLLLAGHETTANALAWSLHLLTRHPAVRARLEREVDEVLCGRPPTREDLPRLPYSLMILKEAMRLYPPAYIIGRRAKHDVTIAGVRIKAGQVIMVNTLGLHRQVDAFPDPDRFDPERFTPEREKALPPYAYIPFGGGPRVCIGNHFALMEGQLLLVTLTQRLRFEAASDAPVEADPLVTLRPKGGVPARVRVRAQPSPADPRHPSSARGAIGVAGVTEASPAEKS